MIHVFKYGPRTVVILLTIAVVALFCLPALADDTAKAGRDISKKWSDAIVPVKAVIKLRVAVEGKEVENREYEVEDVAAVIDVSGLAVVSLTSIDPGEVLNEYAAASSDKYSISTDVTSLKMTFSGDNETPCKIVLRDKDLDLAFITPSAKPAAPAAALDLGQAGKLEVLDTVIILSRFGKIANKEISVTLNHIQAIVRKPKTFYIPEQQPTGLRTGSAVFTTAGKLAGVLLLKRVKPQKEAILASNDLKILPIVVPTEDIAEIVKSIAQTGKEK
ncbi:MAG TPA: hypothetical protein VMB78_08425 [Dissulfurispiraceae bacterium]|nr:hypothetical protein [Dissulfurispiraceae bacterium]